MGVHDGEAQRIMTGGGAFANERAERGTGARRIEIGLGAVRRHAVPDGVGDGDAIAAEPERERHDRLRSERRQPEIAGERHRPEHMREIEVADGDAVADVGPGRLAVQRQIDAFACGEAKLAGRDQHGAVEKRHEAGGDLMRSSHAHSSSAGPSSPAAVTRLWAMSLILRFWFIAVLRNSV